MIVLIIWSGNIYPKSWLISLVFPGKETVWSLVGFPVRLNSIEISALGKYLLCQPTVLFWVFLTPREIMVNETNLYGQSPFHIICQDLTQNTPFALLQGVNADSVKHWNWQFYPVIWKVKEAEIMFEGTLPRSVFSSVLLYATQFIICFRKKKESQYERKYTSQEYLLFFVFPVPSTVSGTSSVLTKT